jgi:putative oxidoreductase
MRRVIPVNLDLALLILRIALCAVMLAHGLPKVTGFSGTAGFFASVGIPLPTVAAAFAALAETVGAVLILLGIAVDIAGLALAIDMVGAIVFAKLKGGFTGEGNFQFEFILLAVALALALAGPGRFAVGARSNQA